MKVVDASAVIAVLFNELERHAVESLTAGQNLIAPSLLPFEITNVCAMGALRFPEEEARYADVLEDFFNWGIALHEVDMVGTFVLARRYDLTAYDASYLWLSRELGAELITLDAQLLQAS